MLPSRHRRQQSALVGGERSRLVQLGWRPAPSVRREQSRRLPSPHTAPFGRNQPPHHARDTRTELKASAGPGVAAHLPFATSTRCRSGLGSHPIQVRRLPCSPRKAGRATPATRCAAERECRSGVVVMCRADVAVSRLRQSRRSGGCFAQVPPVHPAHRTGGCCRCLQSSGGAASGSPVAH